MEPTIDPEVVTEFFGASWVLSFPEVFGLPRVKDWTDSVLRLSFEIDWLPQTTRDHLAKDSIFHTVIQENRASFYIKQVWEHLNQSRQVKLQWIIDLYIASNEE